MSCVNVIKGCVVALLLVISPAANAANLWGYASGGYGSGNTGHGGTSVSGLNLPKNGPGDTGIQGINVVTVNGSLHKAQGIAASDLPNGAFGMVANINSSATYHNSGFVNYNWYDSAGASINYNDSVVVTSASLAAGTAVNVTFSIQIAFSKAITHSAGISNSNYSRYLLALGAGANNSYYLPNSSFYMDSNANKTYESTATPGATALGIFVGSGKLTFDIASRVGDTINFGFNPSVSVYDQVAPYFTYNPFVAHQPTASSFAALGMAFGATATSGASLAASLFGPGDGITLVSTFSGLALPGTENATFANALAAIPIPEPTMLVMLPAFAMLLAGRRR
jgi:hypothetical protein